MKRLYESVLLVKKTTHIDNKNNDNKNIEKKVITKTTRNAIMILLSTLTAWQCGIKEVRGNGVHSADAMDRINPEVENFAVDIRINEFMPKNMLVLPSLSIAKGITRNLEIGIGTGISCENPLTQKTKLGYEAIYGWAKMKIAKLGNNGQLGLAIGITVPGEKPEFDVMPGATGMVSWEFPWGKVGTNIGYSTEIKSGVQTLHENVNLSLGNINVEEFASFPLSNKRTSGEGTRGGVRINYEHSIGEGFVLDANIAGQVEQNEEKVVGDLDVSLGFSYHFGKNEEKKEDNEQMSLKKD